MARSSILVALTLVLGAAAITMLVAYLARRPPLDGRVKLWLILALGVLPISAAVTGNMSGFETTKQRTFCGSCHVMEPYVRDASDPSSRSLAAFHSRNHAWGAESCYACHRDYGLFGSVTTKLTGLRHLWAYYARYRFGVGGSPIHLYRPYPNANCTQCHSMTLPGFADEPEHAAVAGEIASGEVSCAAEGCHGPPHRTASAP